MCRSKIQIYTDIRRVLRISLGGWNVWMLNKKGRKAEQVIKNKKNEGYFAFILFRFGAILDSAK